MSDGSADYMPDYIKTLTKAEAMFNSLYPNSVSGSNLFSMSSAQSLAVIAESLKTIAFWCESTRGFTCG